MFNDTKIAFRHYSKLDLRRSQFLFSAMAFPFLLWCAKHVTPFLLKAPFGKTIIKHTIFNQFIGGQTINQAIETAEFLHSNFKILSILDYAVEGNNNEAQFIKTTRDIVESIRQVKLSPATPFCVFKFSAIGDSAILRKKQMGYPLCPMENEQYAQTIERAEQICKSAQKNNIPVFIDAEESWIQEQVNQISLDLMRTFNKNSVVVYHTIQFYLKDSISQLNETLRDSKKQGFKLGLKLVRGAYMEKERVYAYNKGTVSPVLETKKESDDSFNAALRICINHLESTKICIATHNEESCKKLANLMIYNKIHPEDPRIFFAQLYGMSNHISFNLANRNFNVLKYTPYGPIKESIPYLLRRAEENKSVQGQMSRELRLIKKEIKRRKRALY